MLYYEDTISCVQLTSIYINVIIIDEMFHSRFPRMILESRSYGFSMGILESWYNSIFACPTWEAMSDYRG